jgi:hypothetical protein
MYDIIELEHWLQEARGENPDMKIRTRMAKIDKANILLESGQFTPEEVSYFAQIPMSQVHSEKDRIDREEQQRREFLATGQMPEGEGGYVAIFQK